jgi:DNA-binding transcriptional MerR regulator
MASQSSLKRTATPLPIPDRLYFKIGDVAKICGVESYVLRFWETQFPQLKPNKSGTGQRLYRRRDVEMALEIKRLVHGEGYTIAGARQALGRHRQAAKLEAVPQPVQAIQPVAMQPAPLPVPAAPAPAAPVREERLVETLAALRAELRRLYALLADTPAPSEPQALPQTQPEIAAQPAEADTPPEEAKHRQPRRRQRRVPPAENFQTASLFPL